MLPIYQAVLSSMPCEWQNEEYPETHQKSRVFLSLLLIACGDTGAAMSPLQRASPLVSGKCNNELKKHILSLIVFVITQSHVSEVRVSHSDNLSEPLHQNWHLIIKFVYFVHV